ncbi:MAG: cryptochrome/photolyase family protein [Pseudomonadota bacterium]
MTTENLILVLGDQLSHPLSSLALGDPENDRVLMCEVAEEATYVPHHQKKIAFIFSAMRHFADELREKGWTVDYTRLDDAKNTGSFTGEVERAVARIKPERVVVTEPGEYRVMEAMRGWSETLDVPVDILPDRRFVATLPEFEDWASGRKQLRMEYFYREMRRKTGLLMDDDEPAGGKWNFDAENRKPASEDLAMPAPLTFEPDETTLEVLQLVERRFGNHFGELRPFGLAVTAAQAEQVVDEFITHRLTRFGDYQDAMLVGEKTLYHSLVSFYINAGLLDPLEVCRKVEQAYRDGAPLNAVEGFIRQIIGWREYVRGIYWLEMPEYVEQNFLSAERALPEFYWSGQTRMKCLAEAIGQTKTDAYAHHIQRLMVTGNFAMLYGAHPKEVHEWYLVVYADAYEWVELPNVLGMSQFGDGGLLASKPYAASGNYISKMSNYCAACEYKVARKTGEGACPFNPLYWDFLVRNRDKLEGNPRISRAYSTWDRMKEENKQAYLESAESVLAAIERGEDPA